MNSNEAGQAQEILDCLTAELDEGHLHRIIDARIDDAMSRFPWADGSCKSQRDLLEIAGRFIGHLYRYGLRTPQILTRGQARAEAVSLLERAYRSAEDAGYEAALLDAVGSDGPGLDGVLAQIAEAVKRKERSSYIRWVCTKHLIPCGWYTRCMIAEQLLAYYGPFLPKRIREADPAQWADDIPDLLGVDSATNQWLNRSF
ncbi:MAG: hypothetical protein KAY37_05660 [Phycisphaerae bacterium]|nr:hypothetical protein [Phycisphaerae bacterium]